MKNLNFDTKASIMKDSKRKTGHFQFIGLGMILLMAVACTSQTEKTAQTRLDQVQKLYEGKQYEMALMLCDSMMVWYKTDYGIIGKTQTLKNKVELDFHNEFIAHAQEMLAGIEPQAEPLKKKFNYLPGEAGLPGTYEHVRQKVNNSWNRSFLKVNLNDQGNFWITSHYYGTEWLDHFVIKVYDRDLYILTDTIPVDHPWNRKVQDMNDKWETIDFKEGSDGGAAAFIADNLGRTLKVRFTGKKHYYIVMEQFDKEAIRDGLELAQVLNEAHQLKQSIARHRKALRLLGVGKAEADSIN